MPASLPDATVAQNLGNPNQGRFVIMDPLSGPKGGPLDARKPNPAGGDFIADPANLSTGALSTGIGYGAQVMGSVPHANGFDDDQIPGTVQKQGAHGLAQNTARSWMLYIGGGREVLNPDLEQRRSKPFIPNPYTAGIALAGAGAGGNRDSGTGTGFPLKSVTAAAGVAIGGVVETGFVNRSGVALTTGQHVFGSGTAANAAPAEFEFEEPQDEPVAQDAELEREADLYADEGEHSEQGDESQNISQNGEERRSKRERRVNDCPPENAERRQGERRGR